MGNRLSLIENSREGPAGQCSDDRTREDVGRIVVETSYHENGDPNAIRSDGVRTYCMRAAAVTTNTTTTMTTPPPLTRVQEKSTTSVKKKGMLLSCFPQSKKNIFYFKSPKKENAVPSDYLSGTAPLAAGPRLKKLTSVDSANTISNSSLQEVDEEEFNSSDLVKYMEEINLGIKC